MYSDSGYSPVHLAPVVCCLPSYAIRPTVHARHHKCAIKSADIAIRDPHSNRMPCRHSRPRGAGGRHCTQCAVGRPGSQQQRDLRVTGDGREGIIGGRVGEGWAKVSALIRTSSRTIDAEEEDAWGQCKPTAATVCMQCCGKLLRCPTRERPSGSD